MNAHMKASISGFIVPFLILALVGLIGCRSVPQTTSTGTVHDIAIEQGLSPANPTVTIGDKVRWVNQKQSSVRIELVADVRGTLSCERGFSKLFGTMENSTTLTMNQTASLCFTKTGVVTYYVQMASVLPGKTDIVKGTILITRNSAAN